LIRIVHGHRDPAKVAPKLAGILLPIAGDFQNRKRMLFNHAQTIKNLFDQPEV